MINQLANYIYRYWSTLNSPDEPNKKVDWNWKSEQVLKPRPLLRSWKNMEHESDNDINPSQSSRNNSEKPEKESVELEIQGKIKTGHFWEQL